MRRILAIPFWVIVFGLLPFYAGAQPGAGLKIQRSPSSIVVDGVKESAWSSASTVQINAYLNAEGVSHSWDTNDISASFQILWQNTALYLFVTVRDDVNRAHTSSWWLSDAIELYVDAGNEKSGSYDYNDIHVGFVRKDATVHIPSGGGSFRDNWYIDNVQFVPVNTETGWTAEIGLELNQLRIPTVEGYKFGFDLQVNDNDSGTRDHMLKWYDSSNDSWKNPSLFGPAELGALVPPFQGQRVHGIVTFSDGTPVPSVQVELVNVDNTSQIYGSTTNSGGYYSITIPQTGIREKDGRQPEGFSLGQNYPNPFNPSTVICYETPSSGPVRLEVFDILGRKIRTVLDGYESEGMGQAVWDGTDDNGNTVPAGVYLYTLAAGSNLQTRKMVLLDGSKAGRFTGGGIPRWTEEKVPLGKVNAANYRIIVYGSGIVTYEQFLGQVTGDMTVDIVVQRSGSGGGSCTVSQPWQPSGPDQGSAGAELTFTTGGAQCSQGHPVEYRFAWNDESGYSPWGSGTRSHVYSSAGTYEIIAQARCSVHTGIIVDARRKTITVASSSAKVSVRFSSFMGNFGYRFLVDGVEYGDGSSPSVQFYWQTGEIHSVVAKQKFAYIMYESSQFIFDKWSDGVFENSRNIIVPDHDVNYSAEYIQWGEVLTSSSVIGGTYNVSMNISPDVIPYLGSVLYLYPAGTIITASAYPSPGNTFQCWKTEHWSPASDPIVNYYSGNPLTLEYGGGSIILMPIFN